MSKQITPPATIGLLGGGQLGRMIALEAREMGYGIVTLDPTPNSPCGQVADHQVVADFTSVAGATELANRCQVLTYEFENINSAVAQQLETESYLPQGYQLLHMTQNRVREKAAIENAGIPVAPYRKVDEGASLSAAIAELGFPVVLKTAEGGYDGKGQRVIRDHAQLAEAIALIAQTNVQWVVEKFIPFSLELSIIVARNASGQIETFPVGENVHKDNILHLTMVPARVNQDIIDQAKAIAITLADQFKLIGLLAIEMFLSTDGHLIVNELAPRPHNSGHYSQQGCETSQFEQHIRAVCNLPLASPQLLQPTVMVNILGKHLPKVLAALPSWNSNWKLHLYGKSEVKPLRKMGHVNIVTDQVEIALAGIRAMNIWEMEGIR